MVFLPTIQDNTWLLAVVALLSYVAYKIRVYNRLKAFKGPLGYGWFEIWHSYSMLGNTSHLKYQEICEKYG